MIGIICLEFSISLFNVLFLYSYSKDIPINQYYNISTYFFSFFHSFGYVNIFDHTLKVNIVKPERVLSWILYFFSLFCVLFD